MVTIDAFKQIYKTTDSIDDELLQNALDNARDVILAYTNRTQEEWKPFFNGVQSLIAKRFYSQFGAEGLRARREGAVSSTYENLDDGILSVLNIYRTARPL